MALQPILEAFQWGRGGARMTPEEIAKQRQIAELLGQGDPAFNNAGWLGAIGRGLEGSYAGWTEGQAGRAETANRDANASHMSGLSGIAQSLLGGGASTGGYAGGDPVAAALTGGAPAQSAPMAAPSAADPATARVAEAHANGDWLRYANQGATRSLPLDDKLVSALGGFLPDLGLTMEVFSGGQPGKGSGGGRVGSTRHDHGNAADVFFYQGDRRLDWANEQDRPLFEEVVRRGKAAGVTGFGAGPGYMQPGAMHIGFGNPGVWGAGGSGANAPEWLRNAYNTPAQQPTAQAALEGMAVGETMPTPSVEQAHMGQPQAQQPVQTAQAGGIDPRIIAAMSDPYADDNTRRMAELLLGQQISQQQEAAERARAEQEAQMQMQQRMQAAQAAGVDPRFIGDDEIWKAGVGQQFQAPTTDIQEYEYARAQGFQGSLPEYQEAKRRAGATNVNVNTGATDDFFSGLSNAEGSSYQQILSTAPTAARTLGQLDQLESLLANVETGATANWKQIAGNYGIVLGEGVDDIQAASALINQMVPSQRPPGSGPMSDADLELFKQSVPRIINQPGGNEKIIQTMRAINRYDMELARIVQDGLATAETTDNPQERAAIRADMRRRIGEMQNPLANFNDRMGTASGRGNRTSSGIEWSIEE